MFFCYGRISPLDVPMYAFGFDSPILNIFSYPPTAAVKILHFLQPHIYSVLLFKRKDYFQSQPLGYSGHGHQFFF